MSGREVALIVALWVVALVLRLVYLSEIARAPYFDDPIGDSIVYYDRARQIMSGNWLGDAIYFHSSPIYPYFIALILRLSGGSFLALGAVQALIGAGNCVLVYLLARSLGGRAPAALAGLTAAFYGLLAFFDGELLMIFLTLFFVDLALLLLLSARASASPRRAALAGVSLGLAALDKTNLLLFAPVAAWWLAGGYSWRWRSWRWKPVLLFTVGVSLTVLPVTVRNYFVARDFVMVSSNAGVNLFIGNNPEARGVFHLPAGSGLSNTDLEGSSVKVARAALGKSLKPSEVSAFWAGQAWRFVRDQPVAAARLLGWKVVLLLNGEEIPNHIDFYFVRWRYAPVLWLLFAGYWLVAPLALVGIGLGVWRGPGPAGGLYLGFLAAYTASLLPFFISERYRLPMVPVLIAFAAVAAVEIVRWARARAYLRLVVASAGLVGAALLVNWRFASDYNYLLFDREIIAAKHLEHALKDPAGHPEDLAEGIRELKQVLEVNPASAVAHANLGTAYRMMGFHSGAIGQHEEALRLAPDLSDTRADLEDSRRELALRGDRVGAEAIPRTPFEQAEALEVAGRVDRATELYEQIVARDPFHFNAVSNLAGIHLRRGELEKAVRILERGLERQPANFGLLFNLGYAEAQMGQHARARQAWERCLRLQPGNALVEERLRSLPGTR